jgi:hypothetical protein
MFGWNLGCCDSLGGLSIWPFDGTQTTRDNPRGPVYRLANAHSKRMNDFAFLSPSGNVVATIGEDVGGNV